MNKEFNAFMTATNPDMRESRIREIDKRINELENEKKLIEMGVYRPYEPRFECNSNLVLR